MASKKSNPADDRTRSLSDQDLSEAKDAAIDCVRKAESVRRIVCSTVEKSSKNWAKPGRDAVEALLDACIHAFPKISRIKDHLIQSNPRESSVPVWGPNYSAPTSHQAALKTAMFVLEIMGLGANDNYELTITKVYDTELDEIEAEWTTRAREGRSQLEYMMDHPANKSELISEIEREWGIALARWSSDKMTPVKVDIRQGMIWVDNEQYEADAHQCQIIQALINADGLNVTGPELMESPGCRGKKLSREIDRLEMKIPSLKKYLLHDGNKGYRIVRR